MLSKKVYLYLKSSSQIRACETEKELSIFMCNIHLMDCGQSVGICGRDCVKCDLDMFSPIYCYTQFQVSFCLFHFHIRVCKLNMHKAWFSLSVSQLCHLSQSWPWVVPALLQAGSGPSGGVRLGKCVGGERWGMAPACDCISKQSSPSALSAPRASTLCLTNNNLPSPLPRTHPSRAGEQPDTLTHTPRSSLQR